jgi:epoxyqueuosine reductase QueG
MEIKMKEIFESFVIEFVRCFNEKDASGGKWREPCFAYASANDPMFKELKTVIGKHHKLPEDIMEDGKTVLTYFIPINKNIADSNISGYFASEDWARAYLETIDLIKAINAGLDHLFKLHGWKIELTADNRSWDPETMKCNWSHRHAAYIAGLGTWGVNHGLITEKGLCGRIGTLITDAYIEPTERPEIEACLYKRNGSCHQCVDACPVSALGLPDIYKNWDCKAVTDENAVHHEGIGFADVCGKCMCGMPCSTGNLSK